jgi:acetyl esterase
VLGGLDSHHNVCTEIAARMDLPLIAVDYRLAPEHPSPPRPTMPRRPRAGSRKAPPTLAVASPG